MKCDVCGNETPKEFHWKSAHEELEERVYCSTECAQKENKIIEQKKYNEIFKEVWVSFTYAIDEALYMLKDTEYAEEFFENYNNVHDQLNWLSNNLRFSTVIRNEGAKNENN